MKPKVSPAAFSIAFCVGYMGLFALNKPPFLYFPVVHLWAWRAAAVPAHPGPAIAWYGLLVGAGVIAGLASLVVRDRWLMSSNRGWLWVWPTAAVTGCVILLRAFFLA